ncbi:efflux RND transporter periplasmic adaptor subunit [Herbaspirillum sp. RTI4]|uniref:efflux RND transporter periplasmic adaptor subunit n=1 Tax=Herbaspirillum sp. RTI4 TaxID=3048640 RepID=UPI002AB47A57|nr:efflux RND transporter periplasmic adaptor subunit [Herbaspirillum sp. RTI4]MDY7579950.1 efflux RND transporter periplasmic adaptor subunit [Herbaspirillum sp. RTI4]MEA9982906.1 efflux RND transporter periplasmic adaptor subunit [Herbaspirillum sp. RTI4]
MRFKWISYRLVTIISVAAVLAACNQKPPAATQTTPEVGVFTVKTSSVPVTNELPGRTSAFLVAQVRSRVDGIVLRREFVEGADVKAGQRLYKIDPAPYIAALNTAKATLAKADANLVTQNAQIARYKILVAGNAVSKQDYDNAVATQGQAAADVASGKALLDTATINLGYTDVTSPVSGRIGLSAVTPGAFVQASQATLLTTVQQLDPAYVDMAQSSVDGLKLRRQMQEGRLQTTGENAAKVTLVLEDGRPYTETGTLQFSDVSVNPSTGSVTVRAIFPNKSRVLLPGMFVRATINEGVNDKALIVPQIGVSHDQKGQAVALVVGSDNKVVRRVLVTSSTYGSNWVVESGLAAGDRVIVEGVDKVKPGLLVKAIPATLPATATQTTATNGPNNAGDAQGAASAPAAAGTK